MQAAVVIPHAASRRRRGVNCRLTRRLLHVVLTVTGAPLLPARAAPPPPLPTAHPRLLFGHDDVPELRRRVDRDPFKAMLARLTADAGGGQGGRSNPDPAWDESSDAVRCAFLFAVTGDDAWSAKARRYVEARLAGTGNHAWAEPAAKGLNTYYHGKAVALAYDWCAGAPSWDPPFAARVSRELKRQADVIYDHGGAEQNRNPASNWQGIRFSTAGLLYLAGDEPVENGRVAACYDRVRTYLRENLGPGDGAGWNIEGFGYTGYPWGHVGPFLIAAGRLAPDAGDVRRDVPAVGRALWTLYAATLRVDGRLGHPDFGDDNGSAEVNIDGAMGMAFRFSDPALRPGLKHWYDRTVGAAGDGTFDGARGGTLYSILYYPADVPPADPMSIVAWRDRFLDPNGNGMFTFRNAYEGAGDVVAQVYLKLHGNKGHNGPDALSFRIAGLDTAWAVGGGRYGRKVDGTDVYVRSMNTLYPGDPDGAVRTTKDAGQLVGTPAVDAAGGGHVIGRIARSNVGVDAHQRWFAANYGPRTGAAATFLVCDVSANGRFWQYCTLASNPIATAGNTFTVTGVGGATLRGTVLYPPGPIQWKTGTRPRGSPFHADAGPTENNFVHFATPDGGAVVVMTIAPAGAAHPAPTSDDVVRDPSRVVVSVGETRTLIAGPTMTTTTAAPGGGTAAR